MNPQFKAEIGLLAEALVAQWLQEQGWQILQRRWRCRWGELDLVAYLGSIASQAQSSQTPLTLVEVKARRQHNWDHNGLLAITPQKQAKLWQAAQLFLATYPELVELPCSFSVALVSYRSKPKQVAALGGGLPLLPGEVPQFSEKVQLNQPIAYGHYWLCLEEYIPAAFEIP